MAALRRSELDTEAQLADVPTAAQVACAADVEEPIGAEEVVEAVEDDAGVVMEGAGIALAVAFVVDVVRDAMAVVEVEHARNSVEEVDAHSDS